MDENDVRLVTGLRARPGSEKRERDRMLLPLISAPNHICPRCGDPVPNALEVGEYEGARSRTDNQTEICSTCGGEEAYEDAAGRLRPQSKWPMSEEARRTRHTRPSFNQSWEVIRSGGTAALVPLPLAKEVPDLRMHLLNKWGPTGLFTRDVLTRWRTRHSDLGIKDEVLLAADIRADVEAERFTLEHAGLWWVREDMLNLVIGAMPNVPTDYKASELVFPRQEPRGLVVFQVPWVGTDSENEGSSAYVHALTWSRRMLRGIEVVDLTGYSYLDFASGLGPTDLQRALETGAIFEGQMEHVFATSGEVATTLRGGTWTYLGRSTWPLDHAIEDFFALEASDPLFLSDLRKQSMVEDRRFFAAFCTLVNHKLSDIDPIHLPHYRHKQIARETGQTVDEVKASTNVRLVRLRDVRYPSQEKGEHNPHWRGYSHRFPVSGHFKWVRCGPKRANRRRVFVPAYIKGPQDKPLIVKQKVNVWVR